MLSDIDSHNIKKHRDEIRKWEQVRVWAKAGKASGKDDVRWDEVIAASEYGLTQHGGQLAELWKKGGGFLTHV